MTMRQISKCREKRQESRGEKKVESKDEKKVESKDEKKVEKQKEALLFRKNFKKEKRFLKSQMSLKIRKKISDA